MGDYLARPKHGVAPFEHWLWKRIGGSVGRQDCRLLTMAEVAACE